jgi:hypothetical protein
MQLFRVISMHVACCRVLIVSDSLTTGIAVLNLVLTWMYILTFSEFYTVKEIHSSANRSLLQVYLYNICDPLFLK